MISESMLREHVQGIKDIQTENSEYNYESDDDIMYGMTFKRRDSTRWGEDKFALDITFYIRVRESWNEVSDSDIKSVESDFKQILIDSIDYSGPVILRENNDSQEKSWSRRLIYDCDSR